jgi:hypothetical protein
VGKAFEMTGWTTCVCTLGFVTSLKPLYVSMFVVLLSNYAGLYARSPITFFCEPPTWPMDASILLCSLSFLCCSSV